MPHRITDPFSPVSPLSRRRFLAAAGTGAAGGAAFLAGCGSRGGGASSAASRPAGSAGVVKRGGALTTHIGAFPSARFETAGISADANSSQRRHTLIYSGLVRLRVGEGITFTDRSVEGSLATKWEQPDPQTLTFHLRPGVKFHDKPPVNGRDLTSDDIKFSFDRFLGSQSVFVTRYSSITSVETPDAQTVTLRLKAPDAALLNNLAAGFAWVIAKEAGKPDPKSAAGLDYHDPATAIGTGPFMLESDEEQVQTSLVRNPNYFESGLPYLDKVVCHWIPDQSSQIAGLQTGQIMLGTLPAGSEADFRARNPGRGYGTDYDTRAWHHAMRTDQAPFNDVRVRRALALAWSQAEVKKIWGYPDAPESYGSLSAITGDAYLPLDKLGDNAKWWKQDLTEAKQLLAAAGYPQGFETDYNDSACCEQSFLADQLAANLAKIGVRINIKVKVHPAFLSTTHRGQFDGMAGDQAQIYEPGDWFNSVLAPDSVANLSHVNDPKVNDLVSKQRAELDPQKRLDIIHELVRYLAGQVYQLVMPQGMQTKTWQPLVHGYATRPGFQPEFMVTWLDR